MGHNLQASCSAAHTSRSLTKEQGKFISLFAYCSESIMDLCGDPLLVFLLSSMVMGNTVFVKELQEQEKARVTCDMNIFKIAIQLNDFSLRMGLAL
jgi:hypothetical protein